MISIMQLKGTCKHSQLPDGIFIPEIIEFTLSIKPIGWAADHAYLSFEVKDKCTKDVYAKNESAVAKYQFTEETIDVHTCGIYNTMLYSDPFALLKEAIQGCSKLLHKAVTNAFPHTVGNAPEPVIIENSW